MSKDTRNKIYNLLNNLPLLNHNNYNKNVDNIIQLNKNLNNFTEQIKLNNIHDLYEKKGLKLLSECFKITVIIF